MPTLTRVTFKVKADLEIGQNIRLTGDNRNLGSFSPNRGLDLVTTPKEYPIWRTNRPVNLPAGIPLSYKYVIMSGGLFHGWEPISAHARVIVPEGSEMVVEDEVGVCSEGAHGGYHHESRPQTVSAQSGPSGSHKSLPDQEPPRRRVRDVVHPHVRFQLDEPPQSEANKKVVQETPSADASAGGVAPPAPAPAPTQAEQRAGGAVPQAGWAGVLFRTASPGANRSRPDVEQEPYADATGSSVRGRAASDDNADATRRPAGSDVDVDTDDAGTDDDSASRLPVTSSRRMPRRSSAGTPARSSVSATKGAFSSSGGADLVSAATGGLVAGGGHVAGPASGCAGSEAKFRSTAASRPQKLKRYRMFLVSFNLPVYLYLNKTAPPGKRWSAEWNPNSISTKSEGSVAYDHSVTWVGAVTPYVVRDEDVELVWQLTEADHDEIRDKLRSFDCVPIFLDKEVFVDHYVRSCLLRIRDIFHNVLNVTIPNEERVRRLESEHPSLASGMQPQGAGSISATSGSALPPISEAAEDRPGSAASDEGVDSSLCGAAKAARAAAAAAAASTKPKARKRDRWHGFVKGCTIFAECVMELVMANVTDRDLVWVHNYPLMLVPQLLRAKARERGLTLTKQPKIVFFLHTPFPTSEIFRTLSVRNELLEGVLGANVVGFHTFDHARHFITSCKRFLGLQFHSQEGGRLVVDHMDRAVLIAISHVGIERHLLDNAVLSRACQETASAIREKYRGRTIIVGMDELTRLNGVPLKLLAFEKLLNDVPRYRDRVVFIQHGLVTLSHQLISLAEADHLGNEEDHIGKLEEGVRAILEVKELCDRINRVHGPVVVFKEYPVTRWPSVEARAAIWRSADIMVCTPVMEGLNLLPLEYTFCHRDPAGVVIMSEFSAASRVLNGAIRINCYDIEEVARSIDQALCMSPEERNARRERDCGYITNRSSAAWTRNILTDVEAGIQGQIQAITALDKDIIQGSEYHSVVSFENIVLEGFCQPINHGDLILSFERCSKRLILLDYAGTLTPRELGNLAVKRDFLGVSKRKLSPKVSAILKLLCSDPRNVVFVISGNSPDVLLAAFGEIIADPSTPLGIVAHSGVKLRWGNVLNRTKDPPVSRTRRAHGHLSARRDREAHEGWEHILPGVEDEWSRWVEEAGIPTILEEYTWRTGGSSWRQTSVTTSWQFRQADPEWGGMQAVKLQHELEEAIAAVNVPIAVTRKKHTVELLPKGVDKGKAVGYILEELKRRVDFDPEFCFCVGDDTSDEPMYTSVLDYWGAMAQRAESTERFGHAFTCTVGRKPTAAQYFVNDTSQVVAVLHEMSKSLAGDQAAAAAAAEAVSAMDDAGGAELTVGEPGHGL